MLGPNMPRFSSSRSAAVCLAFVALLTSTSAQAEKRAVPDYDGRGEPATTPGEVLLWVPRVILFPLYVVSEYAVRKPLGWLTTTAEANEWSAILIDFFTFGPKRNIGLIPTALVDFGLRPSIGLYFFADHAGFEENHLRVRAAYGGPEWFLVSARDRVELGRNESLSLEGEWWNRPDRLYYGFGPDSSGHTARYRERHTEARVTYAADLWRSSSFQSNIGVRELDVDLGSGCCGSPTVAEEVARGRFPPPFAETNYTLGFSRVEGAIDSRKRRKLDEPRPGSDFVSPPGSGLRLAARAEHGTDLRSHAEWLRYGATLGGFLDLGGQQRVVGLSLIADFADPLRANDLIPFPELVSLGGSRPMRGFLEYRLVDRSSAVAEFDYTWPIWVWLDGSAHYAVGNVFGKHLEGFELDLLRSSFGLGVRANSARDHAFEVLLAFGTDTIEDGMGIDTVRFVLGAPHGF